MDVQQPIKRAEIAAYLQQHFPHLFTIPVPLKIGIGRDLLRSPVRAYTQKTLSAFLHHWTRSPAYCDAVERGKHRYDLEGNICPMVTNQSRRGQE